MPEPVAVPESAAAPKPAARSKSAVTDWTCQRCEVTVSWMPGTEAPALPASWADVNGALHCLNCRREQAGDAGTAEMPEDAPAADRQKMRSHARIEFEVQRDPERPDNRIAKSCHTSVIAVRRARERLGLPRPS